MDNTKPKIFCTSFCNHGHRLNDGKPVAHECYVLPPAALDHERNDNYLYAAQAIDRARPLRVHRGVRA